jgi:hypothetical protein
MKQCVIGIDPGKTAAIALVTLEPEPELLWHRSLICDDAPHNKEYNMLVLADIKADDLSMVVNSVVLENNYVGANKRIAVRLAQRTGKWESMCYLVLKRNAIALKYLQPTEWQTILKKDRRGTKAASKTYVKNTYNISVNEHEADAICMACYWAKRVSGLK